jgi:uncharacterized protein (DUF1697 family)
MTTYIAFLRGINVGGNVTLPMKELAMLCTALGLTHVRTYINSGNVLFGSARTEEKLVAKLEQALVEKLGRPIAVMVRTAEELAAIVAHNPFPDAAPAKVGVQLTRDRVHKNILKEFTISGTEEVRLGVREVYIYYPDGMGRSKLKFPTSLKDGTVRNINTLTKLTGLTQA